MTSRLRIKVRIRINGKEYGSPEEMPQDVREIYESVRGKGAVITQERSMGPRRGLRSRRTGLLLMFGLAGLVMLACAALFGTMTWESLQSADWPRTQGVVNRTYSERTCGGSGKYSRSTWEAKLTYAYRVDGVRYESGRVSNLSIFCDDKRQVVDDWLLAHYPVGKVVEVHYNPADPAAAFLKPKTGSSVSLGFALAGLVMAVLMGIGFQRTWRFDRP